MQFNFLPFLVRSWATVKAVTAAGKRMMAESRKRHAEIMRKHGAGTGAGGAGGALAAQAAMMAADMGGADDGPAAGSKSCYLYMFVCLLVCLYCYVIRLFFL